MVCISDFDDSPAASLLLQLYMTRSAAVRAQQNSSHQQAIDKYRRLNACIEQVRARNPLLHEDAISTLNALREDANNQINFITQQYLHRHSQQTENTAAASTASVKLNVQQLKTLHLAIRLFRIGDMEYSTLKQLFGELAGEIAGKNDASAQHSQELCVQLIRSIDSLLYDSVRPVDDNASELERVQSDKVRLERQVQILQAQLRSEAEKSEKQRAKLDKYENFLKHARSAAAERPQSASTPKSTSKADSAATSKK